MYQYLIIMTNNNSVQCTTKMENDRVNNKHSKVKTDG